MERLESDRWLMRTHSKARSAKGLRGMGMEFGSPGETTHLRQLPVVVRDRVTWEQEPGRSLCKIWYHLICSDCL